MAPTFDTPINTNDQSIDKVLAAGLPEILVFLDGQLPQQLEQSLKRLALENAGKMLVVQLRTKDSPASAKRFQITGTPEIVLFRNGQVLAKAENVNSASLDRYAAYLLGKGPKPESTPPPAQPASGRTAQASGVRAVTDQTFEHDVLRSSTPVLVDFWAPWCGPCRITEPIVQKLAQEMAGRLNVAKVNVDENPRTAQRYGIQGIPTMMVVKDGRVVDQWTGAMPESVIRSRLSAFITA